MSKKNPKAVYKLLGLTDKNPVTTTTRGSVNTFGMAPTPPAKPQSILHAKNEKERIDAFSQRLAKRLQNPNQ